MRYYLLMYDYENDENTVMLETDENTLGFDRYEVEKGVIFKNWNENITFYFDVTNGNIITDYLANNLAWFIVTEKFKKVLANIAQDSIQFLPITVKDKKSNQEFDRCYLANICTVVDALDLDNSKYDIFKIDENERIISIEKYAIKGSNLYGVHIFRLKDDYLAIFVSELVKRVIQENEITGCAFLEVKVV